MAVVPAPVSEGAKGPVYVRSLLIPSNKLTQADVTDVRNSLANHLTRLMLRAGLVSDASQVAVRDALPNTDFTLLTGGVASEQYSNPVLVVNTWTAWINAALGNAKFCAFYGLYNEAPSPQIVGVRFQLGAGGVTFQTHHLQQLYVERDAIGYLADPVIYAPNDTVFVSLYARAALAANVEALGLKCLVAERIGVIASGQQQPG